MRSLILLVLLAAGGPALAFKTAYVSFEHPDGWRCELSQGVWICQGAQGPERKEAVVLSIATMATSWDTLDNYEKYLKQPRTIQDESGKTIRSKITYTRRRNINGKEWVDSLQLNSELPGFWARYVATTHKKLAILITYIVSEEYYSKFAPQFERMVSSLKPNQEFDLNIASKQGDGVIPGAGKLGNVDRKALLAKRLNLSRSLKKTAKAEAPVQVTPKQDSGNALLYVLGGLAIVGFLIYRRKKGKKSRQEPKPPARKTG